VLPSLGVCLFLAASQQASAPWRLEPDPRDTGEAALQAAALVEGEAAWDALRTVARGYPDSEVSGLAHLAAGLRLLDADKPKEAVAELTQPDVERALLSDRALLALGQAQEALSRPDAAVEAYLAAADAPDSAVACFALPKAAQLLVAAGRKQAAIPALERIATSCPSAAPPALLALGDARLVAGDRAGAAAAFDAVDRGYPAAEEARQARARLRPLASLLPPRSTQERALLLLERGEALLAARQTNDGIAALRQIPLASLPAEQADRARVVLGRALVSRGRSHEARSLLQKVGPGSPYAAEAAYQLARDRARRTHTPDAFELVADRFPNTHGGEEALLAIANHYQKDALDELALPWWRRLLSEYPDGRHVERAAWVVGWGDFRARRYEDAARTLETAARLRPPSGATPGLLYWAARARLALAQIDRARLLLEETVQRYKYAYHGLRAREALARLGGPSPSEGPAFVAVTPPAGPPLPEPRATRLRGLLLIDALEEADDELQLVPQTSLVKATRAWIDWREGRLRPAITAMKSAYPEWIGEAGDRLPDEVWRILFPLRYESTLRESAQEEGLDPALVAAIILQESTFDTAALSRAGARGLMQVMPATGRRIARDKGVRYRRAALHDPEISLDFGTHYLRKMSDRFSGDVEKVLAAYNAGPHRVDAWTAVRGELSSEDFIESIPFSETRTYVMIVLANREQYRRLYGLGRPAPGPVTEGARP
jgi:soluble lytic murein transglycosylase